MSVKILMVCLGNICRSPLAEGILKSKLDSEKFFIDSAGTGHWHIGKAPDKRSVNVAKKNKIDIAAQKCRQFQVIDFDAFDIIYAMDSSNFFDLMDLAPDEKSKNKIKLILDEIYPTEKVDVPDPYYGTENGFDQVFVLLDDVCEVIANRLKS